MTSLVMRYLRDESGATAIEYGLITALISVGVLGGLTVAGGTVKQMFKNIMDGIVTAVTGS